MTLDTSALAPVARLKIWADLAVTCFALLTSSRGEVLLTSLDTIYAVLLSVLQKTE